MSRTPKVGDNVRLKSEPAPLRTYRIIEVDEDNKTTKCSYLDDHIEQKTADIPFDEFEVIELPPL